MLHDVWLASYNWGRGLRAVTLSASRGQLRLNFFLANQRRPCNVMECLFFRIVSDDSSSDSDCESDGEGSSCSSSSDSEVFDVIAEIKRKKAHPDRLHDELWYNDPGQVSLSLSVLHDVAYKGSRPLYATLCNIVSKSTVISCHMTPSHSNQHFSVLLHQKNLTHLFPSIISEYFSGK